MHSPYRILGALLLFALFSCSDTDDTVMAGCGFNNPRQELPWLKERIDSMAQSTSPDMVYCYVVQGTYENRTVFRFEDCNPVIDKAVFTLNCDGNQVDSDQGFVSRQDIKNLTIIWKPRNFACQVDL